MVKITFTAHSEWSNKLKNSKNNFRNPFNALRNISNIFVVLQIIIRNIHSLLRNIINVIGSVAQIQKPSLYNPESFRISRQGFGKCSFLLTGFDLRIWQKIYLQSTTKKKKL